MNLERLFEELMRIKLWHEEQGRKCHRGKDVTIPGNTPIRVASSPLHMEQEEIKDDGKNNLINVW